MSKAARVAQKKAMQKAMQAAAAKSAKEAASKSAKAAAAKSAKAVAAKSAKKAAQKASKKVAAAAAATAAAKASKKAAQKAMKKTASKGGAFAKKAGTKMSKNASAGFKKFAKNAEAMKKGAMKSAGEGARAAGSKMKKFALNNKGLMIGGVAAATVGAMALAKFNSENNAKFGIINVKKKGDVLWITIAQLGKKGKKPFEFNNASKVKFLSGGFSPTLQNASLEIVDVKSKTEFAVKPFPFPHKLAQSGTIQYKTSFDAALIDTVADVAEKGGELVGEGLAATLKASMGGMDSLLDGLAEGLGIDPMMLKAIAFIIFLIFVYMSPVGTALKLMYSTISGGVTGGSCDDRHGGKKIKGRGCGCVL